MDELELYQERMFDDIKHVDDSDNEYWFARELQKVLDYKEWRKFKGVIDKAKESCKNSRIKVIYHFVDVAKTIAMPKGAQKNIDDYKLSRYACYLIAQNGDPRKKTISMAQTYFAIQTRKQEISEGDYNSLTEDEKRLYQRNLTKKGNYSLNHTAKSAGVKNFDKFHNAGYKGLYNGETASDIAIRKGLRYREDILDNMGSDELIVNLFRISQTEQKLKNEHIHGEDNANITHYNMGRDIREFIAKQGGVMPENLATPKKSLKQIEKENKNKFLNIDN